MFAGNRRDEGGYLLLVRMPRYKRSANQLGLEDMLRYLPLVKQCKEDLVCTKRHTFVTPGLCFSRSDISGPSDEIERPLASTRTAGIPVPIRAETVT